MAGSTLTQAQQDAINAAGQRFNVDPRLIESVYGKESSFGSNPLGIGQTDPFHAFGLIAGPGHYDGYGYTATGNTFADAANTVAAFYAYERGQYDKQHSNGQSFLQYADAVYSPPDSNPDSYNNLTTIYKQLGGDPSGEATYQGGAGSGSSSALSGAQQQVNKLAESLGLPDVYTTQTPVDQVTGAISALNKSANDWILYGTAAALFLALIGGGLAIMAGSASQNPTVRKAAEGAAIAA